MNAEFLRSWKGNLAIVAIVTIAITGYRVAFRPDLPTRIAEQRLSAAFPDGQPSATLKSRVITEGMTSLNLHFTLDEFERYMRSNNNEIVWEPENERSFIARTTRYDPMTQITNEVAFQMKVREPSELPTIDPAFSSGAIAITAIAFNSEMVDPRIAQNFLFQMETEISMRRQNEAL
ncbi:hypothetical protein [Ensifer aridi]|uniref:hypothetical protein n=1 Tax=Ensifer aridi TaxID=1708715 RepID=UPI0004228BCA|nr:hypothetical protein [Ensifer aridi]